MRHIHFFLVLFLIAVFVLLVVLQARRVEAPMGCTMELLLCPDGTAVGRVGPSCEFAPCPFVPEPVVEEPEVNEPLDNLIRIDTPKPQMVVTSPIMVSGMARGNWFFEASFPLMVVDWDGRIIGEGIATAQDEWMTTEFVPFTGTVTYTVPVGTPYNRGAIIFKKDNPSGLPEHDDAREIPITFSEVTE